MKKLVALVGLLAGLGSVGFSQDFIKNRIYERVDNTRKFEKCFFPEYIISSVPSKNNGEFIISSYDFNGNGKVDLIACFESGSSYDCEPVNTKSSARMVMLYPNEGIYSKETYVDEDGDGTLETKNSDDYLP